VCETPPDPTEARNALYTALAGKNVGFKQWHPTSVRASGGKLLGRGETGGAWEWTSTVLEPHEGFHPGKFYPEYTGMSFFSRVLALFSDGPLQPTFSTGSTISSWAAAGLPIPALPEGEACKPPSTTHDSEQWLRVDSVNWYQRAYRYVWATARVVKD